MEATMTSGFTDEVPSKLALADSGFTGTTPPQELFETTKRDLQFGIREKIAHRPLREAGPRRKYLAFPDIIRSLPTRRRDAGANPGFLQISLRNLLIMSRFSTSSSRSI